MKGAIFTYKIKIAVFLTSVYKTFSAMTENIINCLINRSRVQIVETVINNVHIPDITKATFA